jgi:hypothetical protein
MVIKRHIEPLAKRLRCTWASTGWVVVHHHRGDFEHGEFFNMTRGRCPLGLGLGTPQHGQYHDADQKHAGEPAMTKGVNVHGVLRPTTKEENQQETLIQIIDF